MTMRDDAPPDTPAKGARKAAARKPRATRRKGEAAPVALSETDVVALAAPVETPSEPAKPVELNVMPTPPEAATQAPLARIPGRFELAMQRLPGRGRIPTARRAVAIAERHAFTVASLALSLGIGWIIGANTFNDNDDLRQLALGLNAVNQRVETMAAQMPVAADAADISALKTSVKSLKASLDVTRQRTADAVAQVKEKVDAQKGPSTQLDRLAKRLDQIEQRQKDLAAAAAAVPVASAAPVIPTLAEPQPLATTFVPNEAQQVSVVPRSNPEVARPDKAALNLPAPLPPSLRAAIPPEGYVLRQVENGVAIIENRTGVRTAELGQVLPGAGKVRSIEKRGQKWVVVTSNGLIDSDLY